MREKEQGEQTPRNKEKLEGKLITSRMFIKEASGKLFGLLYEGFANSRKSSHAD